MRLIIAYAFLINVIFACSIKEEKGSPEVVVGELGQKTHYLENDALKTIWKIEDNSIVLKEFYNKYDHEGVNLENVILFSLELADGSRLSNHDFIMDGKLTVNDLAAMGIEDIRDIPASFSLKSVLPALIPEMNYQNLEIQEGQLAGLEYLRMIDPSTSTDEKEKIKEDLLTYCGHDTLAMLKIREDLLKKFSQAI